MSLQNPTLLDSSAVAHGAPHDGNRIIHLDASPGVGQLSRVSSACGLLDVWREFVLDGRPSPVSTVARALAGHGFWRPHGLQYAGGPWLDVLVIGDRVLLTDPDLRVPLTRALVVKVTPGPGETTVDLFLLDPVVEGDLCDTDEG